MLLAFICVKETNGARFVSEGARNVEDRLLGNEKCPEEVESNLGVLEKAGQTLECRTIFFLEIIEEVCEVKVSSRSLLEGREMSSELWQPTEKHLRGDLQRVGDTH